jgi:hypothetical protein
MRALSIFLTTLFVIALAKQKVVFGKPGLPGDMGYMIGTQEECTDFFCQMAHLSLLNYTFPPPATQKGTIMVNFTSDYEGPVVMFMGRFTAWDPNTGRYFILTTMDTEAGVDYLFYVIKILSTPPAVTSVVCNGTIKSLEVRSLEWDSVDNVMYGVFGTDMYTFDITDCGLKKIGPLSTTEQLDVGLTHTYDSNKHLFWMAVDDVIKGTHNLLTYNTRTQTATMTPSLNNGDYWTLYGINYVPKLDQLIALTQHYPLGYPSIKLVNYTSGEHVDLVPEFIWGDYDIEFDLYPQDTYTNQINAYDPDLNIFWFTTKWTDPENLAEYEAMVYYNLTKGGVEMGSGPMVVYENALAFTNWIWFHWNKTTSN